MTHAKVIVIGSGSAGLTAALYTARANLKPLVLEGKIPGGQLTWTTEVENFPGFPAGVMGPDLMENMRKQAQRFGADCRAEMTTKVDFSARPFRIATNNDPYSLEGDTLEYTADAVIIATGASARVLGLPDEMKFMGHGLGTCATCDGALYKGKKVAVIGGGDTAVEESLFLTRHASKVTLIHRRDTLRASSIMQDRLKANSKVDYAWNSTPVAYYGEKLEYGKDETRQIKGIKVRSSETDRIRDLDFDGIFIAIGHTPNTEIFKGKLFMTNDGYLINRSSFAYPGPHHHNKMFSHMPKYGTSTAIEGVFAAGDVVDTHYRQAITAAGAGCSAAMDCERWLEEKGIQ